MLAYAADNPRPAGRAGSPKALTLIIAGHAVLLAAVMTAKMEFAPPGTPFAPIDIFEVPNPPPPPPTTTEDVKPKADPKPTQNPTQEPLIDRTPPIVDMGQTASSDIKTGPSLPPLGGDGPIILDPPKHAPVKLGPRFATSQSSIKPPYPLDKIRGEEEATLKLRLTIDARGRVIAVDPVGPADPSFLEAARRHILRAWRYKPATEDGVGVPSSTVISLSFRLEDV